MPCHLLGFWISQRAFDDQGLLGVGIFRTVATYAKASPPGLEGHLPGLKAILPPPVADLLTRRRGNMARKSLRTDSTDQSPEFSSLITLTENSKSPPANSTSLRICSAPQAGQVQKSVTNLAAAVGKLCDMDR